MLKSARLYYFSPTGGTKTLGERLCASLAQDVSEVNLALPLQSTEVGDAGLVVAAAPVFGGRIPPFAAEKLRQLEGKGRAAAALAVFGNRAYDDALCELCDILEQRGFRVAAAGAFNAQHSIVPEVGTGRPDAQDEQELETFARAVLHSIYHIL